MFISELNFTPHLHIHLRIDTALHRQLFTMPQPAPRGSSGRERRPSEKENQRRKFSLLFNISIALMYGT